MRCHIVRKQLEAYLAVEEDGLSGPDRERIAAHFSGCEECRRDLSRLRGLCELLAAAPAPPVPDGFAQHVVARAKALQCETALPRHGSAWTGGSVWRRLRPAFGMAVALAAGLALGAFLGNDVWYDGDWQRLGSETRHADVLTASGLEQIVGDQEDSLARAYLDLTFGRDG
ncbi:MAG: zf-HC2 domain-containing protein [Thermoguttaceae bacterium]|nr:zf-HC2 domain-containing protein [Thermoguttaceae bacterium]